MLESEWDPKRWPNFRWIEFACHCGCGRMEMIPEFLDALQMARIESGVPYIINSGWRCEDHDREVGTSENPGKGPHTSGKAVDVQTLSGGHGALVLLGLVKAGILGLGINRKGSQAKGFIHADTLRPRVWSY